jgi:hypothetical protein
MVIATWGMSRIGGYRHVGVKNFLALFYISIIFEVWKQMMFSQLYQPWRMKPG